MPLSSRLPFAAALLAGGIVAAKAQEQKPDPRAPYSAHIQLLEETGWVSHDKRDLDTVQGCLTSMTSMHNAFAVRPAAKLRCLDRQGNLAATGQCAKETSGFGEARNICKLN